MDRSWINARRFSKEHIDGVSEFMKFVKESFGENDKIFCPCRRCLNRIRHPQGHVEDHLYIYGMSSTYNRWIYHGEPLDPGVHNNDAQHQYEHISGPEDASFDEDEDNDECIHDMIQELHTAEEHGDGETMFASLIGELKRELYPGCVGFTRFSFVVKLLHIKSFYRINNVAFTAILKLLSLAFPNCSLPTCYNEAKNFLRSIGFAYDSIDVCPNNCVLFRKDYAKNDECPICGASRWKDGDGNKRIPVKVLRHFPLIPRLKRMFSSKKMAEAARWHKSKRQPVENELSHPADGEAWKDFDRKYGWFAKDARNLRLGLATDGFNPFGNMSTSYSMWSVFVAPYNLPPWECMEQSNLMMVLLIPGPSSPGKDFDVFLEPLVEELLDLWKGVSTYDAVSDKKFDLHAAILWCIHDYPALSTLSGRVTKGYYACVRCDKDPCSRKLRNKICYIEHRRFLPQNHTWRRSLVFDGHKETREKPKEFSTEELLEELEKVKDVRPGKHPGGKKRKRGVDYQCWSRRSCLFDLPYWTSLKLRHNLDVMHIEKNICENLIATLLKVFGKTKDTVNARIDLEDMGIRPNLHLQPDGDSYSMPPALYTMNPSQQAAFCEFIRKVKFPDGYASNLARCIAADGCKLQRLKTHDCHIILQRILPAALRGIMDNNIYEAIVELGNFFRQICCKTLKLDVLHKLKAEIAIILCKLEKIFPPAFFDVMVHLAIHLPDDAILRGPVQYGWMYPVERRLCTLKRFVRNRARPEGSIAEAYVANECLTYCSRYLDDVDTRFNREGRNRERIDLTTDDLSVFQHGVHFLGASRVTYLEADYDKMVWYVLNNCPEVEPYIEVCRQELVKDGAQDLEIRLEKSFATWFKKHMATIRYVEGEEVSDDLYASACEPDLRVRIYSACIVDGVRYHTLEREKNRKTQNSGVMVEGTHNGEDIDFYGCLKEIIQLQYNSSVDMSRSIVLFRCDWFDLVGKKTKIRDDGYFRSINNGSYWYKNDPFILAQQAKKIFYLPDTKYGGNWRVVQKFEHRHVWSVTETDMEPGPNGLAYQDDDSEECQVQVSDGESLENLSHDQHDCSTIPASVVDDLHKQSEDAMDESDSDDEDLTLWQYASDNDGPIIDNADSDEE